MPRQNLDALTGLRAVAAAIIVAGHMRGTLGVPPEFLGWFQTENGVSFFFVLSGFILTYAHQGNIDSGERQRFYLARFARVWPLHVAGIVAIYLFIGSPTRLGTYDTLPFGVMNLLLLQSWVPTFPVFLSYNPVSWSLSVEAFFYALFPFIDVRKKSGMVVWVGVAMGLIVALIVLSKISGSNPFVGGSSVPNVPGFMYANPAARLLEFVVGAALGRHWIARQSSTPRSTIQVNTMQFAAVLAVLASYVLAKLVGDVVRDMGEREIGQWLRTTGVTLIPTAILIYAFAEGRGVLGVALSSRLAVYLGRISFAVYIFHQTPLHYYNFNKDLLVGLEGWVAISTYLALVLGAATFLHYVIEEPCRKRLAHRPTTSSNIQ